MSFWSGVGGEILVGATALNIGKWKLRAEPRLVENSHTGVADGTNFEKTRLHCTWDLEIPWDDTALPDTDVGLSGTSKVTITFKMGASGKTYVLTNTSPGPLDIANDSENDIVRVTLSGQGGILTRPTT